MARTTRVRDVFNSVGQPRATYVERDHGKYERVLANGLASEGRLCLLTGPSKTGKTTLYRKVLSREGLEPIVVRCDAAVTTPEFWRRALEAVDFERLASTQAGASERVSGTGKVGGKIGWAWLAGLTGELSATAEESVSDLEIRERILAEPSPHHLIPVLENLPAVLVVEDFHYLDAEVKTNVFQQWKVFVDNEVSVIVVGTTHHAADLAEANKDLVGRIAQIDLSTWAASDLAKIADQGFNYLRMNVAPSVSAAIAEESAGLPIIVQDACFQMLSDKGIAEVRGKPTVRLTRGDVYRALHEVAATNYAQFAQTYNRLATGPRKRARTYNTYEIVLSLFAQGDPTFCLRRDEIHDRLQEAPLPDDERPTPASVNSMLGALAGFPARNGIELLEWSRNDRSLYILEPSFLFYLRWQRASAAPISYEELLGSLIRD